MSHPRMVSQTSLDRADREIERLHRALNTMNAVSLHQTNRPIHYQFEGALRQAFHPLTCGNDSSHTPLFPYWDGSKITLICRECEYTQDNAGVFSCMEVQE